MKQQTLIVIVLIAIITSVSVAGAYFVLPKNTNPNPNIILPTMNLTVTGANGEEIVLNSSDIALLEAYTAAGGYKRANSNIQGVGKYTGIPILTICNLVGGITSNNTIRATATDNYQATYTYKQVNGQELNTYDPITGNATQVTNPLTMIVAYHLNGTSLSASDGPLSIAIVGPQSLLTDGKLWTRLLVKIEILTST